ncbi:MAG: DUF4238 domain-containing protein [Planctomycetota bacterium]
MGTSNNNTKRQHTIPQFYLKNFCIPDKNKRITDAIWVFHRQRKPFRANLINVAVQKEFYTVKDKEDRPNRDLETILARIESGAFNVIKKILRNPVRLSNQEKTDLAYFLLYLFLRTPDMRENINVFIKDVIKKATLMVASDKTLFENTIKKAKIDVGNKPGEVENLRQFALSKKYNISVNNIPHLRAMVTLGQDMSLVNKIARMNFSYLATLDEHPFITSDNPFVLFNPKLQNSPYGYGIAQKDIEITIPLCPSICLMLTWYKKPSVIPLPPENVKIFNNRTLMWANECIYSSTDSEFIKDNIKPYFNISENFVDTTPNSK